MSICQACARRRPGGRVRRGLAEGRGPRQAASCRPRRRAASRASPSASGCLDQCSSSSAHARSPSESASGVASTMSTKSTAVSWRAGVVSERCPVFCAAVSLTVLAASRDWARPEGTPTTAHMESRLHLSPEAPRAHRRTPPSTFLFLLSPRKLLVDAPEPPRGTSSDRGERQPAALALRPGNDSRHAKRLRGRRRR